MTNLASLLAQADQKLKAGRPKEAIGPLGEAVRLRPSDPAIQHDFGVACLVNGRLAEAIASFRRAVALDPNFAQAYWRMGLALEAHGENDAALASYRRATEIQPSLVAARFRAGCLLEALGHRHEAVEAFRRGAASSVETSLGRICAARALVLEGRQTEAERTIRQLLARDPTNAAAAEMLGTILADAGRFDEAASCYERAIALAPSLAGCFYELARCRRITRADADLVATMKAALVRTPLEPDARVRLHLGLGHASEHVEDYEAAMRHFDSADAIRRGLSSFELADFEALVHRMIDRITPALVARANESGCMDATPVLILGMPRSGTTLVEQIVSSHGQVAAGGELPFWNGLGQVWERDDRADLAGLGADYVRRLRVIAPGSARVTDKMPLNFIWAGLIHLALPRAAIIHCRRSPVDTALSIHSTYFNPRLPFPTGGEALVGTTRSYERLMAHWRVVLPPERFVEVDYETLTQDPEPTIRRVVAACGLSWDPNCLRPERNQRVIRTPSKWQARQPISRGSLGRWRRFEPWLGALAALIPRDAAD